jgi:ATP-dependent Clp protease protease subunit
MKPQPAGLQRAYRLAAKFKADAGTRPLFVAEESKGSLYIYDTIGGYDWFTGEEGVTAKKVADALAAMGGVKTLDIFINSGGGDIFEAKAILAQLQRFAGEKVVHVDGVAASAATLIAMAGDTIITAPAATWMIHEVSAMAWGRASVLRALADVLDLENKTFAETYAARTGQKLDEVVGWMNAETWMNAEEAKKRGFTDQIAETKSTDVGADQAIAAALEQATSTLRGLAG